MKGQNRRLRLQDLQDSISQDCGPLQLGDPIYSISYQIGLAMREG